MSITTITTLYQDHKATRDEIIAAAHDVLRLHHPMTVRQVYYRLVASQTIENSDDEYKRVVEALVKARRFGRIPWAWVEDRLRKPQSVNGDPTMAEFLELVPQMYRRDVWQDQPGYVEAWVEKDALSGVFEPALWRYRITLNVGRGYDGWSSLYAAAQRYKALPYGKPVTILYFGDWDPTGVHIPKSLEERLGDLGVFPDIKRIALLPENIERYSLPEAPAKKTDSRTAKFHAQHGEGCVELDALPPPVLQAMIADAVEAEVDMDILEQSLDKEGRLKAWLEERVEDLPDEMPEGDDLDDDDLNADEGDE